VLHTGRRACNVAGYRERVGLPYARLTALRGAARPLQGKLPYIRERERERDRLFLILIALFALLVLEIQYPINFRGAVGTLTFLGIELNVDALPLPAFLTATWVTLLVITLRYCQTSTNVERQYKYLHTLEDKISAELEDDELYRREGRAYKSEYTPFRWWVRRFYVIVLPVIAIIATGVLIFNEWAKLGYPLLGNIFDLEAPSIGK
jgi:hypothetical protein